MIDKNFEDYGMFVTPKLNAVLGQMDKERLRFEEEYVKAKEKLTCERSKGNLSMIVVDPVTKLPVVRSYKPIPRKADGETMFMFYLSVIMLGLTLVGVACYFLF